MLRRAIYVLILNHESFKSQSCKKDMYGEACLGSQNGQVELILSNSNIFFLYKKTILDQNILLLKSWWKSYYINVHENYNNIIVVYIISGHVLDKSAACREEISVVEW